jgi:CrcB protein
MTPGRYAASGSFLLDARAAEGGTPVQIFLVIVFGIAGTLARYGLQGVVQHRTGSGFPTGTLVVNLVGCFFLGGVGQFALNHISFSPEWRIGLTIGFFGAFTTFSSFGWETVHLLEDGEWLRAGVYVGASVIGGIVLLRIGMLLADRT